MDMSKLPRSNQRRLVILSRLLAGLGLLLILALLRATPVVASEPTGITIHLRQCPQEYRGRAFYSTCHDTPIAGMSFQLDGLMPVTATTDAAGNVTFAPLPPGTYTVRGGPPGDFVRNTIYCSRADNLGQRVGIERTATTAFTVDLAGDDEIVCDWFSVPEYAGGPTPALDLVTAVPSGSPASLVLTLLACPDLTPSDACVVQPVQQVTVTPGGPAVRLATTPTVAEGVVQLALALDDAGTVTIVLDNPSATGDITGRAFCVTPFGADYRDAAFQSRPAFRLEFAATVYPGDTLACTAILAE